LARQTDAGRGASDRSNDSAGSIERREAPTCAVVIVPVLPRSLRPEEDPAQNRPRLARSAEARRDEAVGLAQAIDLKLVHVAIVTVNEPRPATLLGTGKVEEIAEIVKEGDAEVVIIDHPLTPVQQRNLEKALNAKVLDRTALILEIFGRRARTKEGTLQVELAHLNYQKGRLVRSWTHLERQRGGLGFVGGPGETQIEADRRAIDEAMGKLERRTDVQPYMRLKSRLMVLQSDRRFTFMFPQGVVLRDNMVSVLSRIFRLPANGKPIAIIDLSGIPSEVINVVVSVIARMTLDIALWSERQMPILLVCEEAHRYAPQNSDLGFEPAKRALSRIAKEGRKYGLSLCVITQRPSELEAGLLSQCNTIFALRMTSQKDQEFVNAAISDATPGLMGSLPSLRNAEAIVVGEGVTVPMRLHFDELPEDRRPRSGNAHFSALWQTDDSDTTLLANVVDRWRRQRR